MTECWCDGNFLGRWTTEEHNLFLQGLKKYNKQWKQIAELVKTRTVVQIRTHAQKYFQKMEKMKDGKCTKPSTLVALESIMVRIYDFLMLFLFTYTLV